MTGTEVTKAGRDYAIAMTLWMALYVALICVAVWAKAAGVRPPISYAIAIAPALPVGGLIVAVLRFIERSDEYVRALTTRRFVAATSLTLFACTAWGFAESFAGAQHLPLWVVFPGFWAFYGLACLVVPDRT
jgi:hypothetical protein